MCLLSLKGMKYHDPWQSSTITSGQQSTIKRPGCLEEIEKVDNIVPED